MGQLAHPARYLPPILGRALNVAFDRSLIVNDKPSLPFVELSTLSGEHLIKLVKNLFVGAGIAIRTAFCHRTEQHRRKPRIQGPVSPKGSVSFLQNLKPERVRDH